MLSLNMEAKRLLDPCLHWHTPALLFGLCVETTWWTWWAPINLMTRWPREEMFSHGILTSCASDVWTQVEDTISQWKGNFFQCPIPNQEACHCTVNHMFFAWPPQCWRTWWWSPSTQNQMTQRTSWMSSMTSSWMSRRSGGRMWGPAKSLTIAVWQHCGTYETNRSRQT